MNDDGIPPQQETEVDTDSHSVPGDQRIGPDPNLQGYQEDINAGGDNDEPQREQDETPEEYLQMPQREIKEGLDQTAMTKQEDSDEAHDDWREHVEDLDENDKDRG